MRSWNTNGMSLSQTNSFRQAFSKGLMGPCCLHVWPMLSHLEPYRFPFSPMLGRSLAYLRLCWAILLPLNPATPHYAPGAPIFGFISCGFLRFSASPPKLPAGRQTWTKTLLNCCKIGDRIPVRVHDRPCWPAELKMNQTNSLQVQHPKCAKKVGHISARMQRTVKPQPQQHVAPSTRKKTCISLPLSFPFWSNLRISRRGTSGAIFPGNWIILKHDGPRFGVPWVSVALFGTDLGPRKWSWGRLDPYVANIPNLVATCATWADMWHPKARWKNTG